MSVYASRAERGFLVYRRPTELAGASIQSDYGQERTRLN